MPVRPWVAAAAVAVAAVVGTPAAHAAGPGYVPGQFVAKVYTEGLGRAPDQTAWQQAAAGFTAAGCDAAGLARLGTAVYTSAEFGGLGYGHQAEVLALYRGALNREPDQAGFTATVGALDAGGSWPQVVHDVFAGSEFAGLVGRICSGAVDASGSSYGFGDQPPLTIPTSGAGFTGTEAQLQARIDATGAGGTVALAPQAVVRLSTPLVLAPGVVLTTTGDPDPRHYADMGRLVSGTAFDGPLLVVRAGAAARHVWVDGGRDGAGASAPARNTVRVDGGTGTAVTEDKISNTAGPSSLLALGVDSGFPCRDVSLAGNVITAYSSDHYRTDAWTDGISVACEDADVTGNQIIDASDVGIVLYRAGPRAAQHSQVHGNDVLAAGNSAYGALVADPLYPAPGGAHATLSFAGAAFTGNMLWTGPATHLDIALGAGTRAWFGAASDAGAGGTFTQNTTGALSARVQIGVGVAGMRGVSATANPLRLTRPAGIGRCPRAVVALDPATGSGTFDPAPDFRGPFDGCIGHGAPPGRT